LTNKYITYTVSATKDETISFHGLSKHALITLKNSSFKKKKSKTYFWKGIIIPPKSMIIIALSDVEVATLQAFIMPNVDTTYTKHIKPCAAKKA